MHTTLLFVVSQAQTVKMWPVIILDALTFGTFSSLMQFFGVFVFGALTMFSKLVSGTIAATLPFSSNLVTTFVLGPADTAIKGVQILSGTWEAAIPRIFPQLAGSLLLAAPSISNLLSTSLPTPPDCSNGTVEGYNYTILYVSALMQKTIRFLNLILPPESAIPISTLELFSWLARPVDDTGKTRADSITDTCAQKCAVNRSHDTAPLVELGYLMAACTGLYDLSISGADLPALLIMTLAIWWLKPVFKKRSITQFDTSPLQGQIGKLNRDLVNAKESERNKDDTIRVLRAQVLRLGHSTNQHSSPNSNSSQKTRDLQAQISRLHNALSGANNTTTLLVAKVAALERDLDLTREQYREAQFDNEALKCTSTANDAVGSSIMSSFTVPFVLVLVDGDAYKWSASHFTKSQHTPGAKAAQAIKDEVRNYMFNNKAHISLQSRIMVRVFQNISEGDTATIRGHRSTRKFTDEFSKDFTESMPLFDYIDCGTGKERADSKIQELVHLFIANPACHAVFLASATDNGFARMLEQYSCDEAVRDKIVLVHPGYIIREIAALGFKSVEWQSVFQHEYMPVASRQKAASMAKTAENRRIETETATAKLIFEKTWEGLGMFRNLSRGSSTGMVRKVEGGVSCGAVGELFAGDGETEELD